MDIQTIILISSIIFAVSSVMFLLLAATTKKEPYSYAALVSMVTCVSGLIMFEGVFVGTSTTGEPVYFTRWIAYMASCTLLAYTIAKQVKLPAQYYVRLMYLTAITMFTGALASLASSWIMLAYFAIGGVAYVLMVMLLAKKGEKSLGVMAKYVFIGWSAFPLVFILSPEGFGLVGTMMSLVAYLVLDVATKIIFYLELAAE